MSTNMPGFHSFSRFLPHFVLAKLVTSSIRVNVAPHTVLNRNCLLALLMLRLLPSKAQEGKDF